MATIARERDRGSREASDLALYKIIIIFKKNVELMSHHLRSTQNQSQTNPRGSERRGEAFSLADRSARVNRFFMAVSRKDL